MRGVHRRYREFINNVRSLIKTDANGPFRNCEVMELEEHSGFGWAVWAALRSVETKYVMVAQHDYSVQRAVNLDSALEIMEQRPDVRCVVAWMQCGGSL